MINRRCIKHNTSNEKDFIKAGLERSGAQRYKCKFCQQLLRKNNYLRNKERLYLKHKQWKENNKERSKELNKIYRDKKREEIKRKAKVSFEEKVKTFEELKPSKLRAVKRIIGQIIELNRIERNGNKKCK